MNHLQKDLHLMNPKDELTVPKWPFFAADGIFVAAAGAVFRLTPEPHGAGLGAVVVLLLVVAALVAMAPYLLELAWNWQFARSIQDERNEAQRQALTGIGQEIAEAARRWEEIHQNLAPAAAVELNRQFEEAAHKLRQWREGLEEREGKLGEEILKAFREEQKQRKAERQQIEGLLAKVEALAGAATAAGTAAGNGGGERAVAVSAEAGGEVQIADPAPEEPSPPPAAVEEPVAGADQPALERKEIAAAEKATGAGRVKTPRKPQVQEAEEGALFATTTLVATAFVGASNKLFLRGEGPGLSWDEGVAMRFVEIGKWSWTTTEADGPIRFRVFKNDEEEDKAGVLTLEPGQRLDIRPEFGG